MTHRHMPIGALNVGPLLTLERPLAGLYRGQTFKVHPAIQKRIDLKRRKEKTWT